MSEAAAQTVTQDIIVEDEDLTSQLEVRVACTGLVNMDTMTLSDPIVALFVKSGSEWRESGRTEMISDTLDPVFVRPLRVDFKFEEIQHVKFACFDVDDVKDKLEDQNLIGEVEVLVSDLVLAQEQRLTLKLTDKSGNKRGEIHINIDEVPDHSSTVTIRLRAEHVDKKDLFGQSDPFLVIFRPRRVGGKVTEYTPIYKTEVVRKCLSPSWEPFDVSLSTLCRGDRSLPLRFDVYDWNKSGDHLLIGSFKATVQGLLDAVAGKSSNKFVLENEALNAKKKDYKGSGTVFVERFSIQKNYSFLDYIKGGCQINLITCIDYTSSNGNPMFKGSHHFVGTNKDKVYENEYVQAMIAIGKILGPYDYDQQFPAFGFGAKVKGSNEVSHCFPLNGDEENPEIRGLNGVFQAYQKSLREVTLYGPTILSQVLRKAFTLASPHCTQKDQRYQIVVILTDGVVDDLEASVDEIVRGNDLPVSIVIIGIGKANFSKMEFLDADDVPLRSTWGQVAARDIVQFVPFNQFKDNPAELAKAVLEEVPAQLLSYFQSRGILPNPPTSKDSVAAAEAQLQAKRKAFSSAVYSSHSGRSLTSIANFSNVGSVFDSRVAAASDAVPTYAPSEREGASKAKPYTENFVVL